MTKATYIDAKNHLESGAWLKDALGQTIPDELQRRCALHFQELYTLMHSLEEEERVEEESQRYRVVEDIRSLGYTPERVTEYRKLGWKVARRAVKEVDLRNFLDDHGTDIPAEALSVLKTKLPSKLKKEYVKYEQITGYTFSAKRCQNDTEN